MLRNVYLQQLFSKHLVAMMLFNSRAHIAIYPEKLLTRSESLGAFVTPRISAAPSESHAVFQCVAFSATRAT